MISEQTALMNDVVEGAYVIDIVDGSPADEANLQEGDIITAFDGQELDGDDQESLARVILEKNIGDTISLQVWRDGEVLSQQLTLQGFNE
jgi:S1-C subfamily serine protease